MAKLLEKIKDVVEEKAYFVAEKAGEFARIGRAKLEIAKVKRDITKNLAELGGEAYSFINEEKVGEIAESDKVKRLVEKIRLLEIELDDKTKELKVFKRREGTEREKT